MDVHLSAEEIFYAAIIAGVLTIAVEFLLSRFSLMFAHSTVFEYESSELERILKKCSSLFPKDVVKFKGETFRRGMILRITTQERRVFEGGLVGQNFDNMICVVTSKHIIAHDLGSIKEIRLVAGIGEARSWQNR